MSLKLLIIAGDYLPPCSGSSERIWWLTKEIATFKCRIVLSMHLWREFRPECVQNVNIVPLPQWRFRIWELLRWFKQLVKLEKYNILQVELFQSLRSIIIRAIFHPWIKKSILVIHDFSWLYDVVRARHLSKDMYQLLALKGNNTTHLWN